MEYHERQRDRQLEDRCYKGYMKQEEIAEHWDHWSQGLK